jgi:hypothetical protein
MIEAHPSLLGLIHGGKASSVLRTLTPVCHRLRNIQVKGPLNIGALMVFGPNQLPARIRAQSVTELVLHGVSRTAWPFMHFPTIFPNLASLRLTTYDGSDHMLAAHRLDNLLRLGGKLKTLSLRPMAEITCRWKKCYSIMSYLPHLHCLEHLIIDLIRLAPREDPSVVFELPDHLPPSLVSLSLIDYWAISVNTFHTSLAVGTPRHPPYHPEFPGNATPIAYLCQVLERLQCHTRAALPELREIQLISPFFSDPERISHIRSLWDDSFRLVEINFSTMDISKAQVEDERWWGVL